MRGEFKRQDGLILPNNVSLAGAAMVLAGALRGDTPTIFAGLVTGLPSTTMTLADMEEPTIGVNGYDRILIPVSDFGWPTQGVLGVESFIRSQNLIWTPVGGNFDKPVQRVALFNTDVVDPTNPVYALSAAFPDAETFTPDTDPSQMTFQYTLYI